MKQPFTSIGIMTKHQTPAIVETLVALWHFLNTLEVTVLVETETAKALKALAPKTIAEEKLSTQCDLLIVVGGDGSMLHAAHAVTGQNIPLIGINRGNLGFLTDINPSEITSKLATVLQGKYHEEKRFLLTATLASKPKISHEFLNEIALSSSPQMGEFEIYINDHFVCSHRADGLIIATPTGSTAYALSSGGPIIHPSLNACLLIPIASHTLTARPIVVNADEEIKIVVANHRETEFRVSFDGESQPIKSGEIITINKKPEPLRLIHPLDHNYYGALRSKLYWGKKL